MLIFSVACPLRSITVYSGVSIDLIENLDMRADVFEAMLERARTHQQ
jgi:hypothetical protein